MTFLARLIGVISCLSVLGLAGCATTQKQQTVRVIKARDYSMTKHDGNRLDQSVVDMNKRADVIDKQQKEQATTEILRLRSTSTE